MGALGLCAMGLLFGLRHSIDPDHLVAVATMVSRTRSLRSAALVGVSWGVGHSVSVVIAAAAILLFGAVVPERLQLGAELLVAAMLVALGAYNLLARAEPGRAALRPVVTGAVHGLAGSAGATLLVVAAVDEPLLAAVHVAAFALGTVAGMAASSLAMSLPLAAMPARIGRFAPYAIRATGASSVAFGFFIAWRTIAQLV